MGLNRVRWKNSALPLFKRIHSRTRTLLDHFIDKRSHGLRTKLHKYEYKVRRLEKRNVHEIEQFKKSKKTLGPDETYSGSYYQLPLKFLSLTPRTLVSNPNSTTDKKEILNKINKSIATLIFPPSVSPGKCTWAWVSADCEGYRKKLKYEAEYSAIELRWK